MKPDYEILPFKDSAAWRRWLDKNHAKVDGVWLKVYKKASGVKSVTAAEALQEALCFGWIDSLGKGGDELYYLQKFTPRRAKSMWSKRNIEYIARLTEAGLMMPAGISEVNQAKEDGRWDAAYDTPSQMTVPDDFLAELKNHPVAEKFYATLNKSNTYAIGWRLQTAKTEETRKRRQDKIIASLKNEQKIV